MATTEQLVIPEAFTQLWANNSPVLRDRYDVLRALNVDQYRKDMLPSCWDGSPNTVRYVDSCPQDVADRQQAVVMFFPFSTGWLAHMAARVDLTQAAAEDALGVPMRVIALPNTVRNTLAMQLTPMQRLKIASGDFGPLHDKVAATLESLGVDKVHGVLFSQAAAVGTAVMALMAEKGSFDIGNSGIFEPPNLRRQSMVTLMANFLRTGPNAMPRAMDASGIPLLRETFLGCGPAEGVPDMVLVDNLATAFGMAAHPLGPDIDQILAKTEAELLLMRAAKSTVTARRPFERLVANYATSDKVSAIELPGDHGIGDNVLVHALLAHVALRGSKSQLATA